MKRLYIFSFLIALFCSSVYGQQPQLITQEENLGVITNIIYSPNGRYIASANAKDFNIKIWDIQSSKLIGTLAKHQSPITSFAFHPSGNVLFSADKKNNMFVWDLNKWEMKDSLKGSSQILSSKFTMDGLDIIATTGKNKLVKIDPNKLTKTPPSISLNGAATDMSIFGDLCAVAINKKEVVIIDLESFTEKKRFKSVKKEDLKYVEWINGKLLTISYSGAISTHTLPDYTITSTFQTKVPADAISVNRKKGLIAFPVNKGEIKIFNLNTQTLSHSLKTTEKQEKIKALCFSSSGNSIASSSYRKFLLGHVYSNNNVIQIWDINNNKIVKTLKGDVNPVDAFTYNPSVNALYSLRGNHLDIWNLNIGERYGNVELHERKLELKERSKDQFNTKSAELKENATEKGKNELKNLNVSKLNKLKRLAQGDVSVLSEKAKEKTIDAVNGNKTKLLNNTTLAGKAAFARFGFQEDKIVISEKGNLMVTAFKKDEIRIYSLKNGEPEYLDYLKTGQKEFYDFLIAPNEEYLVVGGAGKTPISIIYLDSSNNQNQILTADTDSDGASVSAYLQSANALAISEKYNYLISVFNTGRIVIWSTRNWVKLFDFKIPTPLIRKPFIGFNSEGNIIFINTPIGVWSLNLDDISNIRNYDPFEDLKGLDQVKLDGFPVMTHKPLDHIVSIADNNVNFLNPITKHRASTPPIKCSLITDIQIDKNGYVGISLKNGELRSYDPETGKERYTMVGKDDNAIFKTPDNYYKVAKEGHELVSFRVGKDAYPFEQFDAKFNRPDLVLEAMSSTDEGLIKLYKKAYEKRLKKLGLNESQLGDINNIPTVAINNLSSLPLNSDLNNITLDITANDKKNELNKLLIWINDVPIYGLNGKALTGKRSVQKIKLNLASGVNKIQIAVANSKGIESLKQTLEVTYTKKIKPNLYLLSIGTSKYKNSDFNLTYASKDAKDLVNIFSQENSTYGKVISKTITDEMATTENISNLKSFFKDATIDDVVIVFVAGHGLLDADYNYYYGTHDINFYHPEKGGLAYFVLEGLLDGIAPLKKIMIMDTCHSGEVEEEDILADNTEAEPEESGDVMFRSVGPALSTVEGASPSKMMNELFSDLRRGTGTTVISSAGGAELAMESDDWKNGLFTYCLLFGLRNESADLDKNGEVMLSELQLYVTERVTQLSHGKQVPTTRIQNISLDYRIW